MIAWTAKWSSINLSSTRPPVKAEPPLPIGANDEPVYDDAGTWFLSGGASEGGAE